MMEEKKKIQKAGKCSRTKERTDKNEGKRRKG